MKKINSIIGIVPEKFQNRKPNKTHLIIAALVSSIFGGYLVIQSMAAVATEYYVDGDAAKCSDSIDASRAASITTPWCTIAHAVKVVPEGSTIYMRAGQYPATNLGVMEGRTKYTVIKPYQSEKVQIAGLKFEGSSYLRIQNMEFTQKVGIETWYSNYKKECSFKCRDKKPSHHIEVLASTIKPQKPLLEQIPVTCDPENTGRLQPCTQGLSLEVAEGSNHILIEGNTVVPPAMGHGIYLTTSDGRPQLYNENIIIRNNKVDGGLTQAQIRNYKNVLVDNNEFANCTNYGSEWHTDVLRTFGGGEGLVIKNNSIHDAVCQGIFLKDGQDNNITIENNLVYNIVPPFTALNIYSVKNLRITNNTIAGKTAINASACEVSLTNNILTRISLEATSSKNCPRIVTEAENNYLGDSAPNNLTALQKNPITGTPVFVDKVKGDYRLAAGSPGTDAGKTEGAPSTDKAGNCRTGPPDIGAFETEGKAKCAPGTSPVPSKPAPSPVTPPGSGAPPSSGSTEFYVAEYGDDKNQGTKDKPFRSLNKALETSVGGETIYVASGNYSWARDSKQRTKNVKVLGTGAAKPVINGDSNGKDNWALLVTGGQYLHFENITFNGAVQFTASYVDGSKKAQHITFTGNEITHAGRKCKLRIRNGAQDIVIKNNYIHHCGTGISGPGNTGTGRSKRIMIENNRLDDFIGDGIQFGDWEDVIVRNNVISKMHTTSNDHNDGLQITGNTERAVITGNTIHDSKHQLMLIKNDVGKIHDITVTNNVMYKSGGPGLHLYGATGLKVINNTVWDTRYSSFTLNGYKGVVPTDAIVANNLFTGVFVSGGAKPAIFANNIISKVASGNPSGTQNKYGVDPQFVNPAAGDFRLKSSSPAIDAGTSDGTPTLDKNGKPRVDIESIINLGGGPVPYTDIGAYEYSKEEENPADSPLQTALNVTINSHKDGDEVSDITTFSADATPKNGQINRVEFSINGTLRLTDSIGPYNFTLDSKSLTNGRHVIIAKAYDNQNNSALARITIMVQNADSSAPTAPDKLTANVSAGSILLNWQAAADNPGGSGVVKYNIFRNGKLIGQTPALSHTDNSVAAQTAYEYSVQAIDGAGNLSGLSKTVRVETPAVPDTTAPSPPQGLKAEPIRFSQINITWAPSSDSGGSNLAGYNIYRNGQKINNKPVLALSFGDTGLSADTQYTYYIEAVDGAVNKSQPSQSLQARTLPKPRRGDVTGPAGRYDNKIDIQDLSYIIRKYDSNDIEGDLTGPRGIPDGKVDIYDLSYLIRNYGK